MTLIKRGPDVNDLPDDLIFLSEAARLCRCSLESVRRWVLKGRLPHWRPGRSYLVSRADLIALGAPEEKPKVPGKIATARDRKVLKARLRELGIG